MTQNSDVQVYKNMSDDIMTFETKEDFIRYYERNKEAIDKISTRGLNRKYFIEGYRIGRLKNVLTLYPITARASWVQQTELVNQLRQENDNNTIEVNDKVDSINERLKNIEQKINMIESMLSQILNPPQQTQNTKQFYKNW